MTPDQINAQHSKPRIKCTMVLHVRMWICVGDRGWGGYGASPAAAYENWRQNNRRYGTSCV